FTVSPTSTVDFGSVTIGNVADQTFTVQNTGGGTVSGTVTTSAPFTVVSGGSFNLVGAGATATVTVRFTPLTAVLTATNVTFTAGGGSISRGVTGTGLVGTNPAPVLTSLSPATATAGAGKLHRERNGLHAHADRQRLRERRDCPVERGRADDDLRERHAARGGDSGGGPRGDRYRLGHRGDAGAGWRHLPRADLLGQQ